MIPAGTLATLRADFGGTIADFTVASAGGALRFAKATLTFWDSPAGGTQHTDLVQGITSVDHIAVSSDGKIPVFQGPPGVTSMWIDGGGDRVLIISADYAADYAAAAGAYAAQAQEAAAALAALGTTTDGLIAAALGNPVSDTITALRAALDPIYQRGIPLATLNDAGLSAALTTGATLGIPVIIPKGVTVTLTGTVAVPGGAHLIWEGAILHTATSGAALSAAGTEGSTVALTADAAAGATTITASGHGLAAGDYFRVGSNKVYDASSTSSTIGEICRVDSVAGSVITLMAPLMGGPYNTADSATVSKITFLDPIVIEGSGSLIGNKAANTEQIGISLRLVLAPRVAGIRTKNIDQKHIFFRDCPFFTADRVDCEWASHATQAYGISVSDACVGGRITNLRTRKTRHAFTTNNSSGGKGIPRHIQVIGGICESTLPATGGSGGDAFDTHTAAEYIDFIDCTVLSSSGQGFNMECSIGRIVRPRVFNTTSHGIAVHNESDVQGRVEVLEPYVEVSGGDGVRVTNGTRGTTATYDNLLVRNTQTKTITGTPRNVTATVASTDADGYRAVSIASDAVTVYPWTTYLVVDTEGGASSDNLATINGGRRGQTILVKTAANAHDVTLTQTGNIRMAANTTYTLDAARDSVLLAYDGTTWNQAGAGDFAAA